MDAYLSLLEECANLEPEGVPRDGPGPARLERLRWRSHDQAFLRSAGARLQRVRRSQNVNLAACRQLQNLEQIANSLRPSPALRAKLRTIWSRAAKLAQVGTPPRA